VFSWRNSQADSIHRVHPTAFHTNAQWDPRTKLFFDTCLASNDVSSGTPRPTPGSEAACSRLFYLVPRSHKSISRDENASHVYLPRCRCLNLWSSMHVFELDSAWKFVYLWLFQGLWLATFLRVARRADFVAVIPSVKEAFVRLAEWLLTLVAQDVGTVKIPFFWFLVCFPSRNFVRNCMICHKSGLKN
jgi:hypothetical protein